MIKAFTELTYGSLAVIPAKEIQAPCKKGSHLYIALALIGCLFRLPSKVIASSSPYSQDHQYE